MQALLILAMKNTLGAALLAAIAFGASRLFSRRPALAHVLWLMVLVKLVTPPVWWIPIHRGAPKPMVVSDEPIVSMDEHVSPAPVAISRALVSPARATIHLKELAIPLLIVIWIAGSLALLLLSVVRIRGLLQALALLEPSAELKRHIARLAAQIGMSRTPRAFFTNATISPLVIAGTRRARLIVPSGLWERLDKRQRDALLLHELAHLWRRDHWVRIFELFVTILYWWNPLVWLARRELRAAEERCCDAWVLWAMPHASDDYAATLVESAEFLSAAPRGAHLPALASGLGEFRQLHRRLLMIRERKTVRSLGWTWLLTCAAMIVLPITITRAQQVQRPTNRPSSGSTRPTAAAPTSRPSQTADKHLHDVEIAVQLNRMLPELSFTGMGIGDVFAFLHDVSGIAIVVDWEQLNMAGVDRNTPITLHVRNERLGRCLSSVLEAPNLPEKLAYFVNGGSIEISTSAAIEKQAGGFIRSYSVGDLIHARAGASDTLMETIADSIDPTSWTLHGGSRTIRIEGDQLIVNQSPANQRAVASLLTGMRKLMRNSEIDLSR